MKESIRPSEIAFDIDGVVADTMAVFVQLAHERYGLTHLTRDDLHCFNLYDCLQVDRSIVDDLICLTLDDEHTLLAPPVPGAGLVLSRLALHGPLRFVTARIWPESIIRWLHHNLPEVAPESIQVVATGDPEAKAGVLRQMGIRYFVDDRLETCRQLVLQGFRPLLFDQPWNRQPSGDEFPRILSWSQLAGWFDGNL